MTGDAEKRKAAKRARRPVYGTWERVRVLDTGEERLAFLASHPTDRRILKERGWRRGVECRAEFKQSRNPKFHRLAHAVGHLLVDNVEEFQHCKAHDVLKEVQRRSGVCCATVLMNASPVVTAILDAAEVMLGAGARKVLAGVLPDIKTIPVRVARSLSFDEMDEDEFHGFFDGVTAYIAEHFAGVMLDEVRAEFWDMVQGER